MRAKWRQPFSEDRAEAVAKASPDGYTYFLTIADPLTLAEATRASLPYDPSKDFLPVSKIAQGIGFAMVAHSDLGANTLPELLDLPRRNPGKVSYGSYGIGSLPHVTMEALARRGHVSFLHVPFRGSPPAIQATMQREVDVTLGSPITMMPFINDKRLKPIVLTQCSRAWAASVMPVSQTSSSACVCGRAYSRRPEHPNLMYSAASRRDLIR